MSLFTTLTSNAVSFTPACPSILEQARLLQYAAELAAPQMATLLAAL